MKFLILSVVALISTPCQSQLGSTSDPDYSSNPSGVGFGGALGGANSTTAPTNVPSNTLPRTNQFGTTSNAIEGDQMRIQEQQESFEDPTNPMGGNQEGLLSPSSPDLDFKTSPENGGLPSPTDVPPAPGVGTGVNRNPL